MLFRSVRVREDATLKDATQVDMLIYRGGAAMAATIPVEEEDLGAVNNRVSDGLVYPQVESY